jgi:hypothetical protein
MEKKILIIGHGIAGCVLAPYLFSGEEYLSQ